MRYEIEIDIDDIRDNVTTQVERSVQDVLDNDIDWDQEVRDRLNDFDAEDLIRDEVNISGLISDELESFDFDELVRQGVDFDELVRANTNDAVKGDTLIADQVAKLTTQVARVAAENGVLRDALRDLVTNLTDAATR